MSETLSFDIIDKMFNNLPRDINKMIYEYYESKCNECKIEMEKCEICEKYFCQFHICYSHKECMVCKRHCCPFKMFYRNCECEDNKVCEVCWYKDNPTSTAMNIIDEIINTFTDTDTN